MSTGNSRKRGRVRPAFRPKQKTILVTLILFLTITGSVFDTQALDPQANEYDVKAAFLLNFAKFVEWPAELFANNEAPIIVGVVGESPGGSAIEKINGKIANGRLLLIKRFPTVRTITYCHILFVSSSQADNLPQMLVAAGPAMLTVGESDRFAQMGGIINFVVVGSKVRFDINQTGAKKGGLRISAKLLGLARSVR